jgi:prenyltransferase beta subunit
MKHFLPIFALLALAIPARAEAPKREAFEVGVDNAVQYLAKSQNDDGSWNSGGFGGGFRGGNRDPAVTALCVMALLSSGNVPGEGKYGEAIEKGVRFVCSQQQVNGVISSQQYGMTVMYSHGICTLMLAEVIGLMPDRAEATNLRKQLESAVRLIKSAQAQAKHGQNAGGWRYSIEPGNADMSVTAWQVMALRAAKNVGCDVPTSIIDSAVEYVKRSQAPNGGYTYTPRANVTLACTGAGILSLELCGKEYHKSAASLNAAEFLDRNIKAAARQGDNHFRQQQHFFYGVYYMSQAMFQIGGDYWKFYRQYLHWLLLHPDGNQQKPGGFWYGVSNDDQQAGVNYCTAMAVLALTVEYRFLPIYQRGEEPEERPEK